jgi:hypothetical protein
MHIKIISIALLLVNFLVFCMELPQAYDSEKIDVRITLQASQKLIGKQVPSEILKKYKDEIYAPDHTFHDDELVICFNLFQLSWPVRTEAWYVKIMGKDSLGYKIKGHPCCPNSIIYATVKQFGKIPQELIDK